MADLYLLSMDTHLIKSITKRSLKNLWSCAYKLTSWFQSMSWKSHLTEILSLGKNLPANLCLQQRSSNKQKVLLSRSERNKLPASTKGNILAYVSKGNREIASIHLKIYLGKINVAPQYLSLQSVKQLKFFQLDETAPTFCMPYWVL